MLDAAIYADKFRALDSEFSKFALLISLGEGDEARFEAQIAEAGRLAWLAAKLNLLTPEFRRKLDEAEQLWVDIQNQKRPDLNRFIFETRYNPPKPMKLDHKKYKVEGVPGMHSFRIDDSPMEQELGKNKSRRHPKNEPELVYKLFYQDYLKLAQTKFWPLVVFDELSRDKEYIELTGTGGVLADFVLFTTEYRWPSCILEPRDPYGIYGRSPEDERLLFLRERAKAYSDACRLLAIRLHRFANGSKNLGSDLIQEEAVDRYINSFIGVDISRATARGRIRRAIKRDKLRARELNRRVYIELASFKAFLMDEHEKYNRIEQENDEESERNRKKRR